MFVRVVKTSVDLNRILQDSETQLLISTQPELSLENRDKQDTESEVKLSGSDRQRNQVSIPDMDRTFCSPQSSDRLRDPLTLASKRYRE